MPTTVQFRRGTTAQNNSFTGAVGELTIDTDKDTIVVHDGSTAGGSPLLSAAGSTQSIVSSTTATPDFTFKNTTDDATGPVLRLESDRATPADNDVAGTIEFKASDDAGAQVSTATIISRITDVSNGTEDGDLRFTVHVAGSDTTIATLNASGLTVNSGVLSAPTASTIGNLTLANGSITDSSGTISFGDENLTTTGTITGATGSSIGNLTLANGSITDSSGTISFGDENLTTTGTITGGIGVFDNIRIDNTAGEIDTSSGNLVIDSAGGTVTVDDNLTVTGNLQLDGNLTVSGTTTSVNTTNIEVQDALLELSKNNSGGSDVDSGILITRGSAGNNAAFYWNEGDDKFKAVLTTSLGSASAITDSSTATIVANLEGNLTGTIQTASQGNITTVGALNGGSITSGFGAIDNGASNITTSGTIQYGSLSDGTITITAFVDEDNMASNSATLVPTQQSVKAYVDTSIGAISTTTISEGNTSIVVADSGTGAITVTVDGTTHSTINASGITLSQGNFVGNASTATTLQTARTIGGVSFNGSANINLPGVNTTGNQDTTGNATTATTASVATTVTLVATNTTAATHYVTFVDAATGNENIRTDTNLTYNPSTNVLSTTASAAQYADLAELYSADAEYEPGTVMSFGGLSEITQSITSHDARVAGVVSTAPAYLMNADLENGTALALQGRTLCKVIGRIRKGDLIVSSAVAGVACAMDDASYKPGCVIGKALQSYDSQSVGTIEVVVGRI